MGGGGGGPSAMTTTEAEVKLEEVQLRGKWEEKNAECVAPSGGGMDLQALAEATGKRVYCPITEGSTVQTPLRGAAWCTWVARSFVTLPPTAQLRRA